jgi:enamine deaminase RidA (YjgF/YER057c/UK114 family)
MLGLEKREACAAGTKPSPLYSQSLIVGEMVYLSGITGVDWATGDLVGGTVADRTVSRSNHPGPLVGR